MAGVPYFRTMTGPGEIAESLVTSSPRLNPQNVCGGRRVSGWIRAWVAAIRVTYHALAGNCASETWSSVRPSNGRLVAGFVLVLGSIVGGGDKNPTPRTGNVGRIGNGCAKGVSGGSAPSAAGFLRSAARPFSESSKPPPTPPV